MYIWCSRRLCQPCVHCMQHQPRPQVGHGSAGPGRLSHAYGQPMGALSRVCQDGVVAQPRSLA